jgi:cyclic dehypoxanthinyl futalosine synthase
MNQSLDNSTNCSAKLNVTMDAVIAGEARLSSEDAFDLYHHANMHDLGRWSTAMANRIMKDRYGKADVRTYIIDRNINYTNVCSANCTFCAFKRDLNAEDAYTLELDQIKQKTQELVDIGGTQLLLQGGMHPELKIEWYENMLGELKQAFPDVHLHAFSPPEFVEFVALFDIDGFPNTEPGRSDKLSRDIWLSKLEAIMKRLMAAGLDSIPGGGGEIFSEPVRKRIGLGKATSQQWLDVMETAHKLGMNTSATMMFGHIEGIADRMNHMQRVRDAQDHAIANNYPGKYTAFISWPFQRENTPLGRLPEWDVESDKPFPGDVMAESGTDASEPDQFGKTVRMAGATEYLRTQAISRLFLDNVQSIGSSWVTMGPKIGQLGLFYGATDMGSVMMEENVVSAAGTTYCLNEAVICKLIRDSGYTPAQRDNHYEILKSHDGVEGDSSPDLQVTNWAEHRAKKLHIEN